METERGRWFLAEYARHNRQADTVQVLTAIDRLAAAIRPTLANPHSDKAQRDGFGGDIDRLRTELADMADAIARTKKEIASLRPDAIQGGSISEATEQLDSVVRTTERATCDILAAAQRVQEVAWTMREQGMESEFSDRLDGYATEISTACSLQDLTGQRTRKIIQVLRYLEGRIEVMSGMCSAPAQTTPSASAAAGSTWPLPASAAAASASPDRDLSQSDLDRLIWPVPAPRDTPTAAARTTEWVADTPGKSHALAGAAPKEATKPTPVIEVGSSSIRVANKVEPERRLPRSDAGDPSHIELDPLAVGLRAFAANLMSEYRKGAVASENYLRTTGVQAPTATPLPAPVPVATKPTCSAQPEIVLPLAVAPPLGSLPQRPTPPPSMDPAAPPSRAAERKEAGKSDIVEDLFADVMALTDEERIALFT